VERSGRLRWALVRHTGSWPASIHRA